MCMHQKPSIRMQYSAVALLTFSGSSIETTGVASPAEGHDVCSDNVFRKSSYVLSVRMLNNYAPGPAFWIILLVS